LADPRRWRGGAGRMAQTVTPPVEAWTPQVLARHSTMARPRPPSDDSDGCPAWGWVGPPPSRTDTVSDSSQSAHDTWTMAPGSGLAWRMALLSNSLKTSAASPIAVPSRPASRRSAESCQRAVATLDGAHGSRTTLDVLTSRSPSRGVPDSAGHAPIIRPGNAHLPLKYHSAQSYRDSVALRSFMVALSYEESGFAGSSTAMRLAWGRRGAPAGGIRRDAGARRAWPGYGHWPETCWTR
jgi:hypothetical protein